MDLKDALARLDAIPRRADSAEVSALNNVHMAQSMDIRRYRLAMGCELRRLAQELDQAGVSDLEYHMVTSRAGVDAVRILCQLEIAERQRLSESIAAGTRIDIGDEVLEVLDVTEPDEHGMSWITLTSGRDAVRWDASFVRDKVRLGLWNIV